MPLAPPDPASRGGRVLITGAAGFVGSHLTRRCVAEGREVHVLLRPETDAERLKDILPAIRVHRLLIGDRAALRACLDGARPTHIYHLAFGTARRHDRSLSGAAPLISDLADLLVLVEQAADSTPPPRFFLRTGSIAEYGEAPTPFREEQREQPNTAYAAAIVAGTHYAGAVAPSLPFPLVTARLALVYGAGQAADFLVPGLVSAYLSRQPFTIRRPLDRRDPIHVEDAVDALCRLADAPPEGGTIVNIGSGGTIGVGELAERIAGLVGAGTDHILRMPQTDPVALHLAIGRMQALTGWSPRIGLDEGLAALIADMRRGRVAEAA
ncbi:NAD-dependent epimerase/dehydratase family protein [Sphingomonas sp. PR090111-T3T-6A]|uniref:NAD-dependent epimerase/dehydratase family protein n=1 Tax=Sphingomonas sp. PR090111-T3T-6A TaxID=685778 RepID=UPI00036DDF74|nr:NAD(P)-dependent oxidoreductase [Sphingomonas sp. PR090111-T3T-6A]